MARKPEYKVSWITSSKLDLYHFSKLISGLGELRRRAILTVRLRTGSSPEPGYGTIAWWDVLDTRTRITRRVALEVADSGSFVDAVSAQHCEVYFKRSYRADALSSFQHGSSGCIFRPLGLNHACLSPAGMPIFVGLVARQFERRLSRMHAVKGLGGLYGDLRTAAGLPVPQAFENDSSTERAHTVIFQTRVWPPQDSTDSLEDLNCERALLVRTLRARIGDAFVGGVVADAFSASRFQDIIVRENVRRSDYAEMSRHALVGIYSRGIHHSIAFKLSEYLAAGLCVVSTPLPHELPVPLVAGRHYLPYESANECVEAVRWLISHPHAAEKMRRENREYYVTQVAPAAHVLSLIRRTFH